MINRCSLMLLVVSAAHFSFPAVADNWPTGCLADPITEPLSLSGSDGMRPELILMTFAPAKYKTTIGGKPAETNVVIPTISLKSDIVGFIAERRSALEQETRKQVDDADLELTGFSFDSTSPVGPNLVINGHLSVEKWWKTKWICCKWLECRTCWAKGKLFSRSADFKAIITRNFTPIPTNYIAYSLRAGNGNSPAVTARAEERVGLDFSGKGHTDNSRSFLEKIWDIIGGILRWIDHDLFHGNSKWQFKEWLSQSFSAEMDGPDPYLFQQQLYKFGTPKDDSEGDNAIQQRWFWQSFVEALKLIGAETGFSADGGREKFSSTFKLDYDRYAELLNILGLGSGHTGLFSDPLTVTAFCNSNGRETLQKFIKSVKDGFEHRTQPATAMLLRRGTLREALAEFYHVWGTEEYLRSKKLISRKNVDGIPQTLAMAPAEADLNGKKGVVPIGGNLWALAKEQWWSKAETKCAVRAANRRSGRASRVYPLQTFEDCLSETGFSVEQVRVLDQVTLDPSFWEQVTTSTSYRDPISGGSEYRGWYYCYRNTSMCAGKQRIMWWQKPSMFNARNERHKGIDIHDIPATTETINLVAAADGQLIYSYADPGGWGHALILPFKKDSKNYLAVYGHLPADAKALGGKRVRTGDSMGVAGCSGNAGDGNGNCNNYCLVRGLKRSDIHLHFEIIEVNGADRIKVDPTTVLNFQPKYGTDQHLYNCENTPAVASRSRASRMTRQ